VFTSSPGSRSANIDLCRGFALALALASAGCASPTLAIRGEIAHPVTRDGWPLTVEHFPPARVAGETLGGTRKRPIILCHGILANRRFFELEGEGSLPAVLARAGFDVWLVDLRGRRDGGAPKGHAGAFFGGYDYDVDSFMRDDMDALLAYVIARTGAPNVTWLGHSLGGMIAYARLGTIGDPRIGALITVGSPGLFAPASHHMLRLYEISGALSFLPTLPVESAAWLDGALGLPLAPGLVTDTIFQPENLPHATYRALEEVAVADPSLPELRQLVRGIRGGDYVSADGRVSYTAALSAIRTPALVVVGRADELADPLVGRAVFERLGSSDKELVIAGKAEGFGVDFGHVDLLVGPAARREIYPRIVHWLEEHDGQ
jgi:pimeloyl-ACP methyl ester carboxylesterase